MDNLSKAGILGFRASNMLMDPNMKLLPGRELLEDQERYKRLVGKLNYLTMTQPDIALIG